MIEDINYCILYLNCTRGTELQGADWRIGKWTTIEKIFQIVCDKSCKKLVIQNLLFSSVYCKKLQAPWSSFCYIINENYPIFRLQVVASKYDDWLQSYDKDAKTPDRYEIFNINFKLVQNKKKERKIKKIAYIKMFSAYMSYVRISLKIMLVELFSE